MKNVFLILMTFFFIPVQAQTILQEYIGIGLKNNLALLRQEDNYRHSLEVLREAKGLFYPAISLNARYTVSEGGRVIKFPVGDLLNDAYSALNLLTASERFPVLENQEIRFLRPTEHETKLRIVQPVFNTDIYYNSKIKKEAAVSEQIGVEQYRRELITEIKKAYYNAAMTHRVVEMLRNTRLLLIENVRINVRLEENDKITHDIVLRSQTELLEFDQQLREAQKNRQISNSYLNFLVNRPLTDSIIIEEPPDFNLPQLNQAEYIQQAT